MSNREYAPELDYKTSMMADVVFVEMLRAAIARGAEAPVSWPSYIPPEIPRRSDFVFPRIDNGPSRETFHVDIADHERAEAIEITVNTSADHMAAHYRHSPHLRPRRGKFTILDLTSDTCRYPTETGFYCGQGVERGSYCGRHAKRCYR